MLDSLALLAVRYVSSSLVPLEQGSRGGTVPAFGVLVGALFGCQCAGRVKLN